MDLNALCAPYKVGLTKTLRIMKLTAILLLSACLTVSANGFTQQVTLSVKDAPLETVIRQIKLQTGYSFFYNVNWLEKAKTVTADIKNVDIKEALDIVFKNQPLSFKLISSTIVLELKDSPPVKEEIALPPPPIDVKGKIVNENGEPVLATVTVKGTSNATSTNELGEFLLTGVDENSTLVITATNIEMFEVKLNGKSNLSLTAKTRTSTLDESIVIAYGTTNRRVTTGTVGRVTKDEMLKQPATNPLSVLAGRISGIQIIPVSGVPGANLIVMIRGRNSIGNGIDPLYIVDGIPFPGNTLNNTTGGAGTISSPLDNLNPSDIESIEVLKDADATSIYGSRGANGVILITTKKGKAGKARFSLNASTGIGTTTRTIPLLSTPEYLAMRREAFNNDGVIPTAIAAPDLLVWDTTRQTDWQKELIGHTLQYSDINTSFSGGSEQTQFLLSAGYHKESTVFGGPFGSEKINGSIAINHQSINRRLRISLAVSYLYNRNKLPAEDPSKMILQAPNAPAPYNPDGSLNWAASTWDNPMASLLRTFTNITTTFNSNFTLAYKLRPELEVKITAGYSNINLKEHGVNPRKSYNPAQSSVASATFGNTSVLTIISEPQITYSKKWSNHTLEYVSGFTIQQTDRNGLQQIGSGYTSDELLHSLKAASTVSMNAETDTRYRYTGLFGRAAYNYGKKYFATLTLRRDGSSRFGPANRFANFASAGVAWIFTGDPATHQGRLLSFGKIKASAGKTGNDQIGDYGYLDLYSPFYYSYQSIVPFSPTRLFNPGYGWEEVNKRELGIDLGFFKDRLLISANYYNNTTGNQLLSYPLPATSGFSGIVMNLPATIRNNGLELELNAVVLKKIKKTWTASFNISFLRNKLVKFDDLAKSGYAYDYEIGQSLSLIRRISIDRVDPLTGLYTFKDYDGSGALTFPEDEQSRLDGMKGFFGGFQQKIVLGKLSISVLFQFAQKPVAYNYLIQFAQPGALGNQPKWVLDRWRKSGDVTSIQKFSVNNGQASLAYSYLQYSDAAFSDASFIRLRNLYVSYDLISNRLQRAGLTGLQVFVQGLNLLTITKYKGFDPETQTFMPPIKVITAGVQFNF